MKQAHVLTETEKRAFFRIDDYAVLQYRQVSEKEMQSFGSQMEQQALNRLTMMAHFDSMSRELQTMAKVIQKSTKNTAACLELLDRKINMIGEYLVASEMAAMEVEPQHINISAGGACFFAPTAIITGAMLEVRMILLPEYTGIFSYARVINCAIAENETDPEHRYRVSIEFINMEDNVRDLITRHVLHKDLQGRRQQCGEDTD